MKNSRKIAFGLAANMVAAIGLTLPAQATTDENTDKNFITRAYPISQGEKMQLRMGADTISFLFNSTPVREWKRVEKIVSMDKLLNPDLVAAMANNPKIAEYVEETFKAALHFELNPYLLANQYYQESKYKPNAKSPMNCYGIAQIKDSTGRQHGLSVKDLKDPVTSIWTGALILSKLSKRFGPELALAAYNGGEEGPVPYVERELGLNADRTNGQPVTMNVGHFIAFMDKLNRENPGGRPGLWRKETLGYVKIILPEAWKEARVERAVEMNNHPIVSEVVSSAMTAYADSKPKKETAAEAIDMIAGPPQGKGSNLRLDIRGPN